MFDAFDHQPAALRRDRAPPGASEFEQRGRQRREMSAQQRRAAARVEVRDTAIRRRFRRANRSSGPSPRPSARCSGQGSRAASASAPIPSHTGQ
jgi:hypothetical protein